jgi:hypothetical protein
MKSLGQKLIKIDILLSHLKLNKMSMVTRSSKEKKLPKKIMQENRIWKPKPTTIGKTVN